MFRLPDVTDDQFTQDVAFVEPDLRRLQRVLESREERDHDARSAVGRVECGPRMMRRARRR